MKPSYMQEPSFLKESELTDEIYKSKSGTLWECRDSGGYVTSIGPGTTRLHTFEGVLMRIAALCELSPWRKSSLSGWIIYELRAPEYLDIDLVYTAHFIYEYVIEQLSKSVKLPKLDREALLAKAKDLADIIGENVDLSEARWTFTGRHRTVKPSPEGLHWVDSETAEEGFKHFRIVEQTNE